MILSGDEYILYLNAHFKLLHYVYCIINNKDIPFDLFKKYDTKEKLATRNHFIQNIDLLDSFFEQNKNLNDAEKEALNGFRYKYTSDFIILKQLKKHAIFVDVKTSNVFAIISLSESFNTYIKEYPAKVRATILPYNNKIIFDGFLENYNISFNQNLKYTLAEIYKNAMIENKIIHQIVPEIKSKKQY